MSVILYPGKGLAFRGRLAAGLPLLTPVIVITDFFTGKPQLKWVPVDPDDGWAAILAAAGWDVELKELGWETGEVEI